MVAAMFSGFHLSPVPLTRQALLANPDVQQWFDYNTEGATSVACALQGNGTHQRPNLFTLPECKDW